MITIKYEKRFVFQRFHADSAPDTGRISACLEGDL